MSALNLALTSDNYTPAATLTCSPSDQLTLTVNNASVCYQLFIVQGSIPGRPGTGNISDTEKVLPPGFWNFDSKDFQGGRCVGIQLRSATPGVPALINVSN